jgi:hypothetical protein
MKTIICIHGLASKPPENKFREYWTHCITENLLAFSNEEGLSIPESTRYEIKTAYWANAVPSHLEDTEDYCSALEDRIEELVELRKRQGKSFHQQKKWTLSKWSKRKLLTIADTLADAISIKDNVVEKKCEEVRLYRHDQHTADRIREPIIKAITDAWRQGHEIMIISHSMGTFIAYDVLWQLSQRTDFAQYHDKRIRRLVTMGSPLGNDYVQGLMFGDRYKGQYRSYPGNIDSWINLSAYGDVVSHDSTLEDDFMLPMKNEGMLPSSGEAHRDYIKLWNPFIAVSGKANPHKSYGYLVQPKLAQWIHQFICED